MGLRKRIRVEVSRLVTAERMAPQHRQQHGGHDAAGGVVDVDGAELAAGDAEAQYAAQQRHAAIDHLLAIKPREIRKISGFGYDDFWNGAGRRVGQFGPAANQFGEQRGGG
jgi:hypothetical protein